MEELSQKQRERLSYLEFRVYFTGTISRSDMVNRFGISEPAATRDFAVYRKYAPGNIELNGATKFYMITKSFKRNFTRDVDSRTVLRALVQGIGDDFGKTAQTLVPCEFSTTLHTPDIDKFAILSRAIYNKHAVSIKYLSTSGSACSREIVPFAFAGNGLRWHVRAYDRKRERFGDFIVNRMLSVDSLIGDFAQSHECKDRDDDWNRMVNLEIIPHPQYKYPKMIEQEYGMIDGVLKHKARAAMVGYILRLWNVDCSDDHHIDFKHYQLWLRNRVALYGINNANIAPGYKDDW